jgi:hypothetical protein
MSIQPQKVHAVRKAKADAMAMEIQKKEESYRGPNRVPPPLQAGRDLAQYVHSLYGGSFFNDFKKGIEEVGEPKVDAAAEAVMTGSGQEKKKRQASAAAKERAAVVKQVMIERGVSLPVASRSVKEEGLFVRHSA